MAKIVPILLVTVFLSMLGGCATKPEPVQASNQARIAEEIAQAEALEEAEREAAERAEEKYE